MPIEAALCAERRRAAQSAVAVAQWCRAARLCRYVRSETEPQPQPEPAARSAAALCVLTANGSALLAAQRHGPAYWRELSCGPCCGFVPVGLQFLSNGSRACQLRVY